MISRARISASYFAATCLMIRSQRFAIETASTGRLYFGVQTQWYVLTVHNVVVRFVAFKCHSDNCAATHTIEWDRTWRSSSRLYSDARRQGFYARSGKSLRDKEIE